MGITEMTTANVFTIVITGILVVFVVLALLVFFVYIMGKVLQTKKQDDTKAQEQKEVEVKPQVLKEQTPLIKADEDDEEIVAAITAAITYMFAQENSDEIKPFVIKSIKKVKQGRSAWNQAGIMDNTNRF